MHISISWLVTTTLPASFHFRSFNLYFPYYFISEYCIFSTDPLYATRSPNFTMTTQSMFNDYTTVLTHFNVFDLSSQSSTIFLHFRSTSLSPVPQLVRIVLRHRLSSSPSMFHYVRIALHSYVAPNLFCIQPGMLSIFTI